MSAKLIFFGLSFSLQLSVTSAEAKGVSEHSAEDHGVLFLDEVTNRVVFGADPGEKSSDGAKKNIFSDLDGKIFPGTLEYQALTHVLTKEEMKALESDANVAVPSLAVLRERYDSAIRRLHQVSASVKVSTVQVSTDRSLVEHRPKDAGIAELRFQDIADSGWISPEVEGIRVIPLQDSVMIVLESGEKRILRFSTQGEESGGKESVQFEVAALAGAKVFPEDQELKSSTFLALRKKPLEGDQARATEKPLWVVRLEVDPAGKNRIVSSEGLSSALQAEILKGQELKRLLAPKEMTVNHPDRQPAQDAASE